MPLFRSTRAAKSSNVSGVSALIVKSDMPATYPGSRTFGVRSLARIGGCRASSFSRLSCPERGRRRRRAIRSPDRAPLPERPLVCPPRTPRPRQSGRRSTGRWTTRPRHREHQGEGTDDAMAQRDRQFSECPSEPLHAATMTERDGRVGETLAHRPCRVTSRNAEDAIGRASLARGTADLDQVRQVAFRRVRVLPLAPSRTCPDQG